MAISSPLVAETKTHQDRENPPSHKQEYQPSSSSSSTTSVEESYPQELKNDLEANIAQDPSTVPGPSHPTTSGSPPPGPPEQDFGPKVPLTPVRRFLVFLGILTTLFLAALDQTIVTTTLPSIAKDFNNFSDISWVGTAYLLATTCTQPMYGMASDLFGRKRAMLFASGVFLLGSALCGAAQSMTMLIISRAIQGLGGSGIIALTVILVADIVPLRERGNYQALVAVVFSLAAVLGPLLGGVFADKVSWRWAFYINLPIGTLAIALLVVFLHMNRRKNVTLAENLRALDYSGIALLIVAIVMILLGLNWGADAKYPWNSSVILVLLIVGFAVGGLFLWNEVRVAQRPIIPLRLFKSFSLSMTYLDVFIQGFQFLGLLFYLPLYFQAVNGSSPVRSGVELLPFVVLSSAMAVVVGLLMSRWGTYKEFIVSGFALSTIASGLLILFDEDTSKAVVNIVLVLEGVAMGLVVNTTLLGVHAQLANKSDLALSTSLWTFLRTFGGVFGIALGGAFVQSSLSSAGAGEYAQNIRAIAELAPEVRAPVLRAFVVGLQRYFILMTVISGLGFVASLFIVKNKMGGKK
ncbi:hypothetical protein BGZ93_001684 [Podila epicladia]|nr:hypothetical protein BGZ92_010751 [Podila epicladia]KAG0097893.1 hypothetical protein BGZ93_001684 [Podila epicladia]